MLFDEEKLQRGYHMFKSATGNKQTELIKGVNLSTLAVGNDSMLCQFNLEKDAVIPNHQHPYEQTGYLVSGKMELTIDGKKFLAEPGSSWSIPKDVPHEAFVIEEVLAVEVFTPIREDYLL